MVITYVNVKWIPQNNYYMIKNNVGSSLYVISKKCQIDQNIDMKYWNIKINNMGECSKENPEGGIF
jgi:hypothetical protein